MFLAHSKQILLCPHSSNTALDGLSQQIEHSPLSDLLSLFLMYAFLSVMLPFTSCLDFEASVRKQFSTYGVAWSGLFVICVFFILECILAIRLKYDGDILTC
jgi:uncharacterized membrane protein